MKKLILVAALAIASFAGVQHDTLYTMYVIDNNGITYNLGTLPYSAWAQELHSLETNAIPRHLIEGFYLVQAGE
jgi:hypothetical protein